jgi:hypothetical protein
LQGCLGGARAWNSLQFCDGFRDFEVASKVMQGLSRTRRELCRGELELSVVGLEAVKSGSATGVTLGGQDKSQKWRSLTS